MPKVVLDLNQQTYDALVCAAVRQLRPVPFEAEYRLRRSLRTLRPLGAPLPTPTADRPARARAEDTTPRPAA